MIVLKREREQSPILLPCHESHSHVIMYKSDIKTSTYTPLLLLLKLSKLTLHVVLLHRYGFSLYNVMPATVQFNIC